MMSEKSDQEKVVENIKRFIFRELSEEFPEINGVATGVTSDVLKDFQNLTEEEIEKRVQENLGIVVFTRKKLTKKQQQELCRRVGEKLLKFERSGEIVAQ